MAGREAALSGGLEERTAQDGALLARATGVIASLQVDVGGLLWELDQRFGSSFHEEVAAALPAVLAARAVPGAAAAVSTASASPEALLSAAQERVNLLRRAFDTITGLQTDVDACLCELESDVPQPLPFPHLSPLHTSTTFGATPASGARPGSSTAAADGLRSSLAATPGRGVLNSNEPG
ncbi:hypothetical protein C2E20_4799 [Micractinium conductrix]|uniref:Uncharacterized protein n=1 Tax=Micractinium conductrix TaxID=554055 RepID=A0A2P6VCR8_9CHLO|nr:hypothetical protein C2E20_4799 [Micractinium conductrix]|eukprot:PSC71874.1 hypothetical protein C2E20_4799 [Micractinium conductrix]